ncbi:MAG TPA: LPS export ABC transporter permease LptF [Candidatus Latescibacteria bacterium]|nr:LPS export ABC transporter permease LptF [Candidatus Latescibacterota bacterium]
MPKILDRYIFREVVPPFLVGLLLVAFVLLMNQILVLAELFINKGVPAGEAVRILALLIPSILVFALPMAVLMGILGGLARLSADSEVVAFQSLGIGPRRLLRPILFFGLCGFFLTLPLALLVAPRANHAWVRAMTDTVLSRVQLKVHPLEFNEPIPNMVLFVRDIDRDGSWHDVFASMSKDPAHPRLVMARTGSIRLFPQKRRAVLELSDGFVYSGSPAEPEKDSLTTFERLEEEVDVEGLFASVSSEKRVREKDIGELVRDVKSLTAGPSSAAGRREIRAHWIEIHKKFSLPLACLVFAFLGLPLGIMTGRAGRTGGFSLGLVIILLYYVLLTAGEKMAMDGRLSAFLGMWIPDIILAAAGVFLFLGADRRASAPIRFAGRWRSREKGEPPAPRTVSRRPLSASRPSPVRFPGVLDRYIARKFLAILALAFSALAAATLLATFFERLSDTLRHGKPVGLLVRYVLFKLPEFLAYLLPVAVLTATLLTFGLLAKFNEATALKACGISAYRSILPVLVLSAAVSGLAFLVQERVVPAAHARAEDAWNRIADLPPRSYSYLNRHWVLGRAGNRIYHYDYFEPGSLTFSRMSIFDIDPGRWALTRRFFAEKATIEKDTLIYREGWVRNFAAPAAPPFAKAESGRLAVDEEKDVFLKTWKEPLQMTLGELRKYTAEVRGMGFRAGRLRAELGQKTALPLVSLVMALLAVPFGFSMGKKGALVGVGLSVALAMAYWGTFAVFRSLGGAEVLTPFLGAWGANLIFGLAGVSLLFRLRT